jgi:hypothetical protein
LETIEKGQDIHQYTFGLPPKKNYFGISLYKGQVHGEQLNPAVLLLDKYWGQIKENKTGVVYF